MFKLNYEDRLQEWSKFRQTLETSEDPFRDVIDFYNKIPMVSIHTDPWSKDSWPDPWQLILENQYCAFCIVLGQCYSLQLTERFSSSDFEIHIAIDRKKSDTYYMLWVDGKVLGYIADDYVLQENLPNTIEIQKSYTMQK